MARDQIHALMALMAEIDKPVNRYRYAVRRCAEALSESPEYDRAQERGDAALLEIDRAIREYVAERPAS